MARSEGSHETVKAVQQAMTAMAIKSVSKLEALTIGPSR
jgi:hypothetical protein